VRLGEQWRAIERELPSDWGQALLLMTADDDRRAARAAALLAPLHAGRRGAEVRFTTARSGAGARPDTVRRLLRKLDMEGIEGRLELVAVSEADEAAAPAEAERASLAASWQAQVDALPPDWSDVYAEVELRASDQLERAALLCSPLNPLRTRGAPRFRFRSARRFGYGAAAQMVHRCLERLDAERIVGEVRILHALSETDPVATQGPVWYIGGRPV
jgi:hypothetical protein